MIPMSVVKLGGDEQSHDDQGRKSEHAPRSAQRNLFLLWMVIDALVRFFPVQVSFEFFAVERFIGRTIVDLDWGDSGPSGEAGARRVGYNQHQIRVWNECNGEWPFATALMAV